jgi:hypothetical protein
MAQSLCLATLVGLDYNLNGQGWNSIALPSPTATTYGQVLPSLSLSSYSVIVRARFSNGTEAVSAPCGFSFVIGCLNIGANQFVLNAQQSPLSTSGVIQFKVGEPQKIYVETQCNNTALIRNVSTGTEYPLFYDPERFKWTTDTLVFNAPGTYDLEVEIANIFGEVYSRVINTVVVVPESSLTTE